MVLFMPTDIYGIDAAGKFFLVAVPTLVGSVLRIPYTVATARFGGRNWTVMSALFLFVPTLLTLYLMMNPGASYTTFMLVAATAGIGGGNFASSMTNINAFYPQRLKGWALGLNAGGGNIGVPMIDRYRAVVDEMYAASRTVTPNLEGIDRSGQTSDEDGRAAIPRCRPPSRCRYRERWPRESDRSGQRRGSPERGGHLVGGQRQLC